MASSPQQFLEFCNRSGVLLEEEVRAYLSQLSPERQPRSGEELARELVRGKLLTAFQAQQIYAGKGKNLILGKYLILDKLGQGGMGMVFKAEHRKMKRIVALKILSPNVTRNPDMLRRFQREVEAAAKLEHQHVVTAYDADEASGTHFLVMQYVEGMDLAVMVKQAGPLKVDKALACVLQAARGLEYAHAHGVVHRDIKPSNLLIDRQGTVKILDMGLARLESTDQDQDQLTGTGQIMGTADYMAPEQALDTKNADARADIYSLGITLWYLLTGRPAYPGDSLMARLLAHRDAPIPSLRDACPEVSPDLEAVFLRMVAKTPEERYQSMTEVITDLERCQGGQSVSMPVVEMASEDSKLFAFLQQMDSGSQPTLSSRGKTKSHPGVKADPRTTTGGTPLLQTMMVHSNQVDTDPQTQFSLRNSLLSPSRFPRRLTESWRERPIPFLATGAGCLVLVIWLGLFFFSTTDGAIRVEVHDPEIEVTVKGTEFVFRQEDRGNEVRLTPGEHTLVIQRGDFQFETDRFILGRGETVALQVDLLAGEIVARQGDQSIGRQALPSSERGGTNAEVEIPESDGGLSGFSWGLLESTAVPPTPKWISLFDNRSLMGWEPYGINTWRIEEDVLVGDDAPLPGWLLTEREFDDFELDVEYRFAPGADTGIFIRTNPLGNGLAPGYQEIQIMDESAERFANFPPPHRTGALWGVLPAPRLPTHLPYIVHRMRILVVDNEVRVTLNDQLIVQGPLPPECAPQGRIGLQVFHEQVEFLSVRVRIPDFPTWLDDAPQLMQYPVSAERARERQQAWADHLGLPIEYTNSIGMKFMLIPPGIFLMGSTAEEVQAVTELAVREGEGWELNLISTEMPQHPVRITRPFYMGVTEVTQVEWNAYRTQQRRGQASAVSDGRLPVGNISDEEIAAFCQWLSQKERSHYRLPTEAEWEYACRAGTTTPFAFGDSLSSHQANFNGLFPYGGAEPGPNRELPMPVGSFPPNAFGLYDMHGNVWEVCSDLFSYRYYLYAPRDDPQGPVFGNERVIRGGDYEQSRAFTTRSTMRAHYPLPYPTVGVRLVREIGNLSTADSSNTTAETGN